VSRIDFNSDLGESFGLWERGADEALMPAITSANVACGFHAGDPDVMRLTVDRARRHGVSIGAHPGLPDLLGFGRRVMDVTPAQVRDYVLYQVGALDAFVRAAGLSLHHVKPHGALYMMALDDAAIARAVADAVAEYDDALPLYTLAGSEMEAAGHAAGLRVVPEFFADRPLRSDGSVVMFRWWEEFEATPESVASRAVSAAIDRVVRALDGQEVPVVADTICVHSDTPGAGAIGPAVRRALEDAGVTVTAEAASGREGAASR
jgi:5-oxoprolinase (ATP-hydrolysing) subunit A